MTDTTISRVFALADMDIKRVDRKGREVTAYATAFGQPVEIRDKHGHYWEEINRTAFNRTISHGIDRIQVFYNHGYDLTGKPNMLGAVPLATPKSIKPDGYGLLTRSYYGDGDLADAVLDAWEDGRIRGQSFSGKVHQDRNLEERQGVPHIERTELGLREYGPTPFPSYEGAGLVAIRSKDDLAEMIRAILPGIVGTLVPASPTMETTTATPSGLGGEDQEPVTDHSSHNVRVARARAALIDPRLRSGHVTATHSSRHRDRD